MEAHLALFILNIISISLILMLSWAYIFKLPPANRFWHTVILSILITGFFTRLTALYLTVFELGSSYFE